eukprot:jgi/Orpsp1_1/1176687/evm.model.c7180000058606.2
MIYRQISINIILKESIGYCIKPYDKECMWWSVGIAGICIYDQTLYLVHQDAGGDLCWKDIRPIVLDENINIVSMYQNSIYKENLNSTLQNKDYLKIFDCYKNKNGNFICVHTYGYIKNQNNYYMKMHFSIVSTEASINRAVMNQYDCSESIGGLIQVYESGPVYLCLSDDKSVEFSKYNNKKFLLEIETLKENIFVDNYNNTSTSIIISSGQSGNVLAFNNHA